jgi:hypothetical protein
MFHELWHTVLISTKWDYTSVVLVATRRDCSRWAQTLGSQNTTLQKLILCANSIRSTGVGVLLETMEQSSHITDLDLQRSYIGDATRCQTSRASL